MNIETLTQLEESIDQLTHTRKCETERLYEGLRCNCGIEDLREGINKYKSNMWKEQKDLNERSPFQKWG